MTALIMNVFVTPQVRHPERVCLREGSSFILAKMCHLREDPSRKQMRSG